MAGPTPWQRVRPYVMVFDGPLMAILGMLACAGLLVMWSAAYDFPGRFSGQLRNYVVAVAVMWVVANVPPQVLLRLAVPIYATGLVLLIAVALFGLSKKGATRWLNLGVTVIQPSEIMKIGMPMMLAWYFHKHEAMLRLRDFIVAGLILAVPTLLIMRQPDLGTAILVFSAGAFVLFFAGLSFKLIAPLAVVGVVGITALVVSEEQICQPEVKWVVLKEYQKNRVCTLLDPMSDPLGKGFHTIQSTIAVGAGGLTGKGFMDGSQSHLEFIPERTSDFIFAVYSEEFGLAGNVVLLLLYTALIFRGLFIAGSATTFFNRLMAGAVTMIFFTYAFVNMGMVTGILPVVGVPLPFLSYGGTALVTLAFGCGILMSVQRHKSLVQR
ncbi:MAG: rod shape-determining protein RodA [Burkholderiaceae bacterium]